MEKYTCQYIKTLIKQLDGNKAEDIKTLMYIIAGKPCLENYN